MSYIERGFARSLAESILTKPMGLCEVCMHRSKCACIDNAYACIMHACINHACRCKYQTMHV